MNFDKTLDQAKAMAMRAKPGILKHSGKVYTLVFDHATWEYQVFENGFEYIRYNTKSISTAKSWLKHHLEN